MTAFRLLPRLLLAAGLAAAAPLFAQLRPDDAVDQVRPVFAGTLKGADSKTVLIEDQDANLLEFHCSRKTRFLDGKRAIKPADLKPGERVSVEARKAPDGSLDALTVRREPEGT
jgi:hypothetical protein